MLHLLEQPTSGNVSCELIPSPVCRLTLARRALRRTAWLGFMPLCLAAAPPQLPGTAPLEPSADRAAEMVAGLDRYLERERLSLPPKRLESWQRAMTGLTGPATGRSQSEPATVFEALRACAETNRTRLRHILGVVDPREPVEMRGLFRLEEANPLTPLSPAIASGPGYRVFEVAWRVLRGVEGEGLLLLPEGEPRADIIAIPDCDWTPEQAIGLDPGVPDEQQFPRRFAEAGCRVIVPALVDRGSRFAGNPGVRSVQHSQRETLWRAAYEMGRTPLGYEVQKVLAAADWMDRTRAAGPRTNHGEVTPDRIRDPSGRRQELGVVGYGEGGLLALLSGALDTRFLSVGVCGAVGLAERNPEQPIYRNVWSVLQGFGDEELLALVLPRGVFVERGKYPEVQHTDAHGGAPGSLWRPTEAEFQNVESRLSTLLPGLPAEFMRADSETVCGQRFSQRFLGGLTSSHVNAAPLGKPPERRTPTTSSNVAARSLRQYRQILEDTQHLMREAEYVRREYWKPVNSARPEQYAATVAPYRTRFAQEIVGMIPKATLPPRPRSRLLYETNGVRGYEVVLEVHPDVFAFGILCLPPGQGDNHGAPSALDVAHPPGKVASGSTTPRRPAIVCQHGLEGRPRDVADPSVQNGAYHQFAYRLAEQGFVTFAPQHPYIGGTRFRQVLRKAQPLGLTLWSFMVRQHEVITDWLASLDEVDPARIGFYGLSYGGKSAMRIPVLVDRYCLSICSADYNEWIWKNVSARAPYSYLWTIEYDMPEFNLGNTFNYAELSWLICPRPFMVERGHDDGVAPDEWVAFEFAKTRRHYVKLGLGDRTEIEFFDGPHTIHGVGTFRFLREHLRWPE